MLLPQAWLRRHYLQRALRCCALCDPPRKVEGWLLSREKANENFDCFIPMGKRVAFFQSWLRRHFWMSLPLCGPLLLLSICMLLPKSAFAKLVPPVVKTIWAIDHQGTVRFCYGREVSVIYFAYDQATAKTSIVRKAFDGRVESVGEFPGSPNERSLSCSDDGETIVAIDGERTLLYLSRGGRHSLYKLSGYWAYGFIGVHSLLSPDGNSIILPEVPRLTSGDDLLAKMRIFLIKDGRDRFFVQSEVFSDEGEAIVRYAYLEHDWKKIASIRKPAGFGASEIALCGSHEVASLSDDVTAKFLLLSKPVPIQNDWLGKIGIRKLFKRYRSTLTIIGSSGRCAFPLYPVDRPPWLSHGFVSFDDGGVQEFSFGAPVVAITNREILLNKDGCFALVQLFKQVSGVPQFTNPQQVQLLGVPDKRCRS